MLRKQNLSRSVPVMAAILVCGLVALVRSDTRNLTDLEQGQPSKKKIEDLLSRMTLSEKIGQMNMPCVYEAGLGRDDQSKVEGVRKFTAGTYVQEIGPAGGFFTLANTILHQGARQQATFFNELQRIALEETRLKIPLLQTEEGTHGLMASGGTIFPEGLGIGSTWNMDLVKQIYAVAAREGRSVGIHQLFTLVIEPNRDPRLGRNEEGFSEDPYLCSRIAEAIVHGTQGSDVSAPEQVVAGLCHYPGQSQPASGMERGAMEISERMLREVFLRPWVAGIKNAGALGVMATYPAIDGVPVHSSHQLLTKVLREELGFQGLVLGEGGGIGTLEYERLAPSQKEAGAWALGAGLDVGISFEPGYMDLLIRSVEEGRVARELIDRSVRRILLQKFKLGLFDHPYVNVDRAVETSHAKAHQDLAIQTAREGIVLLKNENQLLPLSRTVKSIAVIGPNANHQRNQLGDYIAHHILQEVVTVYEGIRQKVPSTTKVTYVKGCNVVGTAVNEISAAQKAAREADVAIVVVGENERRAVDGTDGEGKDVASLDLTGLQEDLVKAVLETGKPTVVVLINGRPLSVRWIAERVPAILEAWNCGEQGGAALADILFGDINPSGHLPITIPRHVGQLPAYYNYKPSKDYWVHRAGYVDMPATPLFEFGRGLSYTQFEYGNLQVTPPSIPAAGEVTVSLDVKNTGSRQGEEVVQLYLRDEFSTVTRPVKELKGFRKIALNPGENQTVKFRLTPQELCLLDRNMEWVVEPGSFEVMVGRSSEDIRLRGKFLVKE
jgi:beta-glucosidase